jgi:hypothetical protein
MLRVGENLQACLRKSNPEKLGHFNLLLTGFCYSEPEWLYPPDFGPTCLLRNR